MQLKQVDSKYLLRIKDVSPMMDNGNYTCVVSNRHGEIRATIELLVTRSLSLSLQYFSSNVFVDIYAEISRFIHKRRRIY